MEGLSNCYVFKSRLQEYAQKAGLTTPVYDVVKEGPPHDPSFSATVIVNEKTYASLPGFANRKAAEQSAAEVALLELSNCGPMKETISSPVHEIGLCKNMLQEYALKMNLAIPVYTCLKSEVPGKGAHFTCTVDVGGIKYVGGIAKSKKEAEIKAARTALLAMKSASDNNTETPSHLTVIPTKRKVVEEPPKSKKRKKKLPNKKVFGKKQKRSTEVTADVGEKCNSGISEALNSSQPEILLPESEKENNKATEASNSSQVEILLVESEKENKVSEASNSSHAEMILPESEKVYNGLSEALNSSQAAILFPESAKGNNELPEACDSSQAEIVLPGSEKGNNGLLEACNSSSHADILLPVTDKGNNGISEACNSSQAEILLLETDKGKDELAKPLNSGHAEILLPKNEKENNLASASYLEGETRNDSSVPASFDA